MLNTSICRKARMSRDARFDGTFFTAVKTTGIYCRTICPVFPPKEENVLYFSTAVECASAGFRPCLRCRPDSAPNSPAWKGVNATLDRAIRLIDEGVIQECSLTHLAERLGISDRYLRKLFDNHLGMSPKKYALYQQCLFAKKLLHQTQLPITQIALASGFSSVRRFNDYFKEQLQLTPTAVRKSGGNAHSNIVKLNLYYRPPFDWAYMQKLLSERLIQGLEWTTENTYGRTFNWLTTKGKFTAIHVPKQSMFTILLEVNEVKYLKVIVNNIRRILDVDVDMHSVEKSIQQCFLPHIHINKGIRLPGIWNVFEAGIRAILGQQISVNAARDLVSTLVENLGVKTLDVKNLDVKNGAEHTKIHDQAGDLNYENSYFFPTPESIVKSDLAFFKMPASRKQTLRNLAQHFIENKTPNHVEKWLELKGIGPWTMNYAQLRGQSDPDIFLSGDLGVIKALEKLSCDLKPDFLPKHASPWGSYFTFQLWSQL